MVSCKSLSKVFLSNLVERNFCRSCVIWSPTKAKIISLAQKKETESPSFEDNNKSNRDIFLNKLLANY